MRVKLNSCPRCHSNKVYIEGGQIILSLGIKRLETYVYCEQCGCKGKIGHTNTTAVANWNSGIVEEAH
jgi:hypothetical protein